MAELLHDFNLGYRAVIPPFFFCPLVKAKSLCYYVQVKNDTGYHWGTTLLGVMNWMLR